MATPNPAPLAPVPQFPERGRQVYQVSIGENVTRGRSSGRLVDPVLAAAPDDAAFDDEAEHDQAAR